MTGRPPAAERRLDPFGLAALAATGTMAAHQIGYLSASDSTVSHRYLGVVGPGVLLVACVAAWIGALRVVRRDPGRTPPWWQLAAVQLVLFALMELGERALTDAPATASLTPLVLGLALQPVAAVAALRLLRVGRRLIEAFLGEEPFDAAVPRPMLGCPYDALVPATGRQRVASLRGPPVV